MYVGADGPRKVGPWVVAWLSLIGVVVLVAAKQP